MPDTVRTRPYLQTAYANNTTGAITEQTGRDFIVSVPFNLGAYSGGTAYVVNDLVQLNGTAYICTAASTGNTPPNATYWQTFFNLSNASIYPISSSNLTGQSAAVATVLSVTPAVLGTYRVDAYLTVTARTLDVVQVSVTYTDETSTSRTVTLSGLVAATGVATINPISIRAASGTAIVVSTALTTGGGTITYDIGATIQQLN
jgi:hypothetical protein